MMNNESNRFLVNECCKGNNDSFRRLFNIHSPWMMGVCLRYAQNQQDAQDVLQDSWIKIHLALKDFVYQSDSQFVFWLKRIIINTSINHLKTLKNSFVVPFENENFLEINYNQFEDLQEEEDFMSQQELLFLIQKLPVGYRTVFNLYVFEGNSHKDIAELLNISENTSKTQLFKARNILRKKIKNSVKQVAL